MNENLVPSSIGTMEQYQAVLNLTKEAFGKPISLLPPEIMKTGLTTSSGLTGYDLSGPSKHLYPVN
jgi:hypothetical protein